jgi:hypothetical protein
VTAAVSSVAIPTGLHLSAQGCRVGEATLGQNHHTTFYTEGVASKIKLLEIEEELTTNAKTEMRPFAKMNNFWSQLSVFCL